MEVLVLLRWWPFRIEIIHQDSADPRARRSTVAARRLLTVGVAVVLTMGASVGAGATPTPAPSASPSEAPGTAIVSIPLVTMALRVSPSTVSVRNCRRGNSTPSRMGFPSASCDTDDITITAQSQGQVFVQFSDAMPADGGTPWRFCVPHSWGDCVYPYPRDIYSVGTAGGHEIRWAPGVFPPPCGGISDNPCYDVYAANCDQHFHGGWIDQGLCDATDGASSTEQLFIAGPSSSSEYNTTYTLHATWIMVPRAH
jgi:hypothetical protein